MADNEKRFILDMNLSVTLSIQQIWPDGDAPENPTAADVIAAIKESDEFSPLEALRDWNLDDDVQLTVMPVGKPSERATW